MASDKPFNYYPRLWLLLSRIIIFELNVLQTPKIIAVKIVKWTLIWKKKNFVDLVRDDKSVAGFPTSH